MSSSYKSDLVTIDDVDIIGETDKAWHIDNGRTKAWIPKSLCEVYTEDGTIVLQEWLAIDKELI